MSGKNKKRKNKINIFISVVLIAATGILTAIDVAGGIWGAWTCFAVCLPITIALIPVTIAVIYHNAYFICRKCGGGFRVNPFRAFIADLPNIFDTYTSKTVKLKCPHCNAKTLCKMHFGKLTEVHTEEINGFGCYKFNRHWIAVEMTIDEQSDAIDFGDFVVPEEGLSESDFQCAYLEQYLNAEGTERICELYDTPETPVKPCRVVFFIYRTKGGILRTPYGEFPIDNPLPMPTRLKKCVEFEEAD